MRISIDGKRTEISSKRTLEEHRWTVEVNKANGRTEDISKQFPVVNDT